MFSFLPSLQYMACSQQFAYTALVQFLLASSWNGNLLEPSYKRFNSAYLLNKFCICWKIPSHTFKLDASFSCWSQVTMTMTKKSESNSQLWTPLPSLPSKKKSSYLKFIEVTHSRKSGRRHGSGVIIILLKLFSLKFLILSTGVPRHRSSLKIAAGWP